MPDSSTYSGVPIPTNSEAPSPAAAFAPLRAAIDPQLVLKATSVSNRDTLYGGTTGSTAVPLGTLVSCAALKTVWQKTSAPPSAATWATLAEVGTAVTSGALTAATNFSVTAQWAQRLNGFVSLRGTLTYSGTTITGDTVAGSTPGNIVDVDLCTIQSTYLPNSSAQPWPLTILGSVVTGVGVIGSGGAIQITSLVPSGVLRSGDTVRFATIYPGA